MLFGVFSISIIILSNHQLTRIICHYQRKRQRGLIAKSEGNTGNGDSVEMINMMESGPNG